MFKGLDGRGWMEGAFLEKATPKQSKQQKIKANAQESASILFFVV